MSKFHAQAVQQIFKGKENIYTRAKIEGHNDSMSNIVGSHDRDKLAAELSDPSFSDFVGRAYASDSGVSFRINPETGDKEMMIAGTRTMGQWGLNLLDSALYGGEKILNKGIGLLREDVMVETGVYLPEPPKINFLHKLDFPRTRKQHYYERIARDNGVDVIYGHSRGGAMVADMDFDGTKVGLDAAMLISSDTDMLNIEEGGGYNPLGLFDEAIGYTGEDNMHMDLSTWKPHQVWAS